MSNTSFFLQKTVNKPSFLPKFSDADLLKSIIGSAIWKDLFLNKKEAGYTFLKAMLILKLEMFASPLRAFLHYGMGQRTTGVIITIMSGLMMLAFNTLHLVGYLASFFPFLSPLLPLVMSADQMYQAAFIDIRSIYMLGFIIGFLLLNSIHMARIWLGATQKISPSYRGTSWLHKALFRRIGIGQSTVYIWIEPVLVAGLGYGLLDHDFTFGLYLMISGSCLFIQEFYDGISKKTFQI